MVAAVGAAKAAEVNEEDDSASFDGAASPQRRFRRFCDASVGTFPLPLPFIFLAFSLCDSG